MALGTSLIEREWNQLRHRRRGDDKAKILRRRTRDRESGRFRGEGTSEQAT